MKCCDPTTGVLRHWVFSFRGAEQSLDNGVNLVPHAERRFNDLS